MLLKGGLSLSRINIGQFIFISEFNTPTANSGPVGITTGPDGALWFTEVRTNANKIGRVTTPASTSPLLAATLPSSRSVQVGNPATAFATILNTGAASSRRTSRSEII